MNIKINRKNFLDIVNLKQGVFSPLSKFVSIKDFLSISNEYHLDNGDFFPFPIFLNLTKEQYNEAKKNDILNLYYEKVRLCSLNVNSYFTLDKKKIGQKIFFSKNLKHPTLSSFIKENDYFVDGEITDLNYSFLKKINFSDPKDTSLAIKKKNFKNIAGFHTRNVPHKAHEWIHKLGLKKCGALFVQPMIGQYKSGEYKENIIIKSYKKIVKIYNDKKIIFALFNSYPRYAGPREAMLHALVRRNYGCTHFLIGRDHAGIENFYGKYDSQKICKKFSKLLGIKIVDFMEPYLCKGCKNIMNQKCIKCKKSPKILVSGSNIRKMVSNNKRIPEHLMRKEISALLNKKTIISKDYLK